MNASPITDLHSLRAFFAAQPESTWTENTRDERRDGEDHERHCAIGLLDRAGQTVDNGRFTHLLNDLFRPLVTGHTFFSRPDWALADVNNGADERYPQSDPRSRVLAAIDDLIAGTVKTSL